MSFPLKIVIFHSYVSSPAGNTTVSEAIDGKSTHEFYHLDGCESHTFIMAMETMASAAWNTSWQLRLKGSSRVAAKIILVVDLPLWKYESQLGWWNSQYMAKPNMFQTTNQIRYRLVSITSVPIGTKYLTTRHWYGMWEFLRDRCCGTVALTPPFIEMFHLKSSKKKNHTP